MRSSDAASLVVDILTSGGDSNSPALQRVFWAVIKGVVVAVIGRRRIRRFTDWGHCHRPSLCFSHTFRRY